MIREPVVSGRFYPESKDALSKIIQEYTPKNSPKIDAQAVILPHAGYTFSGKVAVTTIAQILKKKKVIILGTNHSALGVPFGLWPEGSWRTPLGNVEIDRELASQILSKSNLITADPASHNDEHSIEVELPILQYFLKDFKFVPISCMQASLGDYQQVASDIAEAIKTQKNDILLVASTDFTHYEADPAARRKDRLAIEQIIDFDEEKLISTVFAQDISICGLAPVAILLALLKKLGTRKSFVSLYQTSADVTGDFKSVVGYAGVIFK